MDNIRVIEVKKSIYEDNDTEAKKLRDELVSGGTFLLNIMSSPGAGKTSVLRKTCSALKDNYSIGVMEADIDSDVDAKAINALGVEAVQIHTGGMCHLDAGMTRQGLKSLTQAHDLIFLENVGNLVCPAEFDTGAVKNAMILSVPEGDDKALKYPLMFEICDLVLINKIDTMPMFDFDMDRCRENIRARNPGAVILPVSAKTGEGMEGFYDWLDLNLKATVQGI